MTDHHNVNLGFRVEVAEGDALQYPADVLAVKHAPRSGGFGAQVRKYLGEDSSMLPKPDDYRIWPGRGIAQAEYILMVGAPPVFSIRYPQLRQLGRRFLEALHEADLDVRSIATTLHGVRTGAGLDEVEAFRSLLMGMADAYADGHYPPTLEHIVFIENDENRVRVMQEALVRFLPSYDAVVDTGAVDPSTGDALPPAPSSPSPDRPAPKPAAPAPAPADTGEVWADTVEELADVAADADTPLEVEEAAPLAEARDRREAKRDTSTQAIMGGPETFEPDYQGPLADETTLHVFVAMPFKEDYDDQYYLAIQPVVHAQGLLCERMDLNTFTGDIVDMMLERIRTARALVALLDGANPNVYLEVGFAWGVGTPTILLARRGEPLPFDVRGHRVLIYDHIYRLKQMLEREIRGLQLD